MGTDMNKYENGTLSCDDDCEFGLGIHEIKVKK